jgi:hypothetical protein
MQCRLFAYSQQVRKSHRATPEKIAKDEPVPYAFVEEDHQEETGRQAGQSKMQQDESGIKSNAVLDKMKLAGLSPAMQTEPPPVTPSPASLPPSPPRTMTARTITATTPSPPLPLPPPPADVPPAAATSAVSATSTPAAAAAAPTTTAAGFDAVAFESLDDAAIDRLIAQELTGPSTVKVPSSSPSTSTASANDHSEKVVSTVNADISALANAEGSSVPYCRQADQEQGWMEMQNAKAEAHTSFSKTAMPVCLPLSVSRFSVKVSRKQTDKNTDKNNGRYSDKQTARQPGSQAGLLVSRGVCLPHSLRAMETTMAQLLPHIPPSPPLDVPLGPPATAPAAATTASATAAATTTTTAAATASAAAAVAVVATTAAVAAASTTTAAGFDAAAFESLDDAAIDRLIAQELMSSYEGKGEDWATVDTNSNATVSSTAVVAAVDLHRDEDRDEFRWRDGDACTTTDEDATEDEGFESCDNGADD